MSSETDPQTKTTLLAIDREDIAPVLSALEKGHTVRARIAVGERRATPDVLAYLAEEVERLGGRFVPDPANDINPGDKWRQIKPPRGTSRDSSPIVT